MNIFILDRNPQRAARLHCDVHVNKMAIEMTQMLSAAHHVCGSNTDPSRIMKLTHKNHPCTIWIRDSMTNYKWGFDLLVGLLNEYQQRYGDAKRQQT